MSFGAADVDVRRQHRGDRDGERLGLKLSRTPLELDLLLEGDGQGWHRQRADVLGLEQVVAAPELRARLLGRRLGRALAGHHERSETRPDLGQGDDRVARRLDQQGEADVAIDRDRGAIGLQGDAHRSLAELLARRAGIVRTVLAARRPGETRRECGRDSGHQSVGLHRTAKREEARHPSGPVR